MSGHIMVNFSTVSNAAQEVKATAGRIEAQLNDLKQGVQRIAQSWEGSAQEGYRARQAQWDSSAADLHQVLSQISSALENAAQNYTATENKNSAIWG
jgi:WXG100 family type VII secretion target